jgi:hypothetical protein
MKTNIFSNRNLLKLFLPTAMLFISSLMTSAQEFSTKDEIKNDPKIDDFLKLTVVGNGYSDQTIVVFIPGATWGFDPEYDAYKLQGIPQAPQLYSIIPGINLAINALPAILINLEVQLGFKVGALNTYTITASNLYTFDPAVTIFLDDTRDDLLTDLVSDSVYTFSADPGDDIQRFKLRFRYPVYLDAKVFLEGCYNGSEMNVSLNDLGVLPLNQPYNTAPWNYTGTESVASLPSSDIVDWVLVEIRDTTSAELATPATRVERAAGFLFKNGQIRSTDGTSNLRFTQTISDSLFVVVWHRNHLGIISTHPVSEAGGIYTYDFSTSADQALGGTLAQKDLGSGVYGLFAGDIDASGTIDDSDKSVIWNTEAGNTGYLASDADLDGQTDNPDKNDIWLNNLTSQSQVPE